MLGCNKEVAVLQMTSIKRSHPFLAQMATLTSIMMNIPDVVVRRPREMDSMPTYAVVSRTLTVTVIPSSVMYNKLYSGRDWVAVIRIIEATAYSKK